MFKWIQNKFNRSLENPSVSINDLDQFFSKSSSGETVNRQSVLALPYFYRAVNLVSGKVAKCPLQIYATNKKGGSKPATDHPAYKLLMRRPNDLMTPMVFKQTCQSHLMLVGNSYAYIFRDDLGKPTDLLILDPTNTHAVLENGKLIYVTTINGVDNKMLPENVLHFRGMGFDGLTGYSVIDILRESLGLGLALQKYGSIFFSNNAMPKMVITLPANLKDPEKIARFRTTWGSIHEGLNNSHKVALLENGSTITTIGGDNDKTQFLDSMNFNATQIANICGVPASKLGVPGIGSSYNSLEQEDDAFLADSLDSWLVMYEEEIARKLLTEAEFESESHFVLFDRNALRQTDKNIETDILVKKYNNGLISFDEMRGLQNLNVDVKGCFRLPNGCTVQVDPSKPPEKPPEPQPVSQPDQQPDQQSANRLKSLTTSVVGRLMKRVGKSLNAGKIDLEQHRGVFDESLQAFESREHFINEFFDELAQELEALPKQDWSKVMERHQANLATLVDKLMEVEKTLEAIQ